MTDMDTANPSEGATHEADLSIADAAALMSDLLSETPANQEAEPAHEPDAVDDAEAPAEDDASEDAETDAEPEATRFQTIEELAEATGMEVDDFLATIGANVKIDGQESRIPLKELREGYQRQADYSRKTQELAEARKAFEAERAQVQTELQQRLQAVSSTLQREEQQLVAEYQKVPWDELRVTDPAEWGARRQEFVERANQIESQRHAAQQAAAQQHQELSAKQAEQQQQYLQQESQRLLDAVPEWRDEGIAKAERGEVRSYLKTLGYDDDSLSQLYDHRAVVLARKAMLYDRQQSAGDVAKKKVAPLPKLQKPGAATSKTDAKTAALKAQRDKLRRSGSIDDAAALFSNFI